MRWKTWSRDEIPEAMNGLVFISAGHFRFQLLTLPFMNFKMKIHIDFKYSKRDNRLLVTSMNISF